ncbi:MAG: hypothetical protein LCH61_20435 [Proteobacteria bacterium]|nr:hypothetical protein [Pseudomonadota bacterium]
MSSTSDARTVNNTMRHAYRVLSDEEKAMMSRLKDVGGEFLALLHQAGGTNPEGDRLASRELSLAQTKIEEAVMWAVKHVTR